MKNLFTVLALIVVVTAQAQLTNGSTAPDFTLDDYYGNTHTLYDYLDSGKTVFVEIFAAHCPSCWNYHQTNRMKNLYNLYGPNGTNEAMVLALEYDPYNDSTAFTGNHDPWVTAGDWLTGTPYPIFNVEGPDRNIFSAYNVSFYPVIYKICPDRKVERMSTSMTAPQLYQKVKDCPALSLDENSLQTWYVAVDQQQQLLILNQNRSIRSLTIYNSAGQLVQKVQKVDNNIDLKTLPAGLYLIEVQTEKGSVVEKITVNQ